MVTAIEAAVELDLDHLERLAGQAGLPGGAGPLGYHPHHVPVDDARRLPGVPVRARAEDGRGEEQRKQPHGQIPSRPWAARRRATITSAAASTRMMTGPRTRVERRAPSCAPATAPMPM